MTNPETTGARFAAFPSFSMAFSSGKTLFPLLIVFFGGLNLILVQWVLAREMTALLLGTELVVLLVSVSYFAGLSLGYGLAGRIPRRMLPPLGVVTLILHLTLPVWFRLLAAAFEALHAYALVFIVLPLLTPFVISAFYSIFLPLFADDGTGKLPALYALELLGSACGVLTLVLLGGIGLQAVYAIYALGLLAILLALGIKRPVLAVLIALSAAWLAALPAANEWSNALWYEALQGLPAGTKTLFTGYSPYQKVDALEAPDGSRYLYLDGLNHFGTSDGSRLNVIMGQIPASIIHPQNAVVFGAGSMQMAAMIADYAGLVTTVEIDPLVVNTSERFFLPFNRMDTLTNRRIVVDDAKHFIANTDETFDMAATDLPAAYSIQTATLYSAPFFRQIANHLAPNGVFSVNLTSKFSPTSDISRRIAAGLLQNFKDVLVVTPVSAGWSFAYASDDLPFDRAALENALHDSGEVNFVIYDTPAVRAFVGDAQPITLDSMDVVLKVSSKWVSERLRGG